MAKYKKGQTFTIPIEGFFKPFVTPPMPEPESIEGFSLPKAEQKWRRPYLPTDDEAAQMTSKERLDFITRELIRRVDGYWFWNNGTPTYITGDHYFVLTYWFMAAITEDGYPEYRQAAAKWFYVIKMADESPDCYGLIMLTSKRFGKTEYGLGWLYNGATLMDEECLFGMQSISATEAKNNLFKSRLMRSHRRIPQWLRPVSNDDVSKKEVTSELTFMGEKLSNGKRKAGLNNVIDWRPTIPTAYQGKRPRKIYIDEPGSIDEMSLTDWWTTVREQLALGKRIFGKAMLPTTFEDMNKKSGPEFVKLWEDSDPLVVDKNGRTKSGLWRYFKPFFLGREGFVDEYGNDLIDEAMQFRANQLELADASGKTKLKRQYPETEDEAFGVINKGTWEDDVKDILEKALKIAEANDVTRYYRVYTYAGEIQFKNTASDDPQAVMIVEGPQEGVKYAAGIDSIGTDNQTGGEDGSKLAFSITKGYSGSDFDYSTVCLYEFRPDKMEESYRVISSLIKHYGAVVGNKLFKVMGETNAGATNLLNYLINDGLKPFMAKKPGVGVVKKDSSNSDLYWLYRTDDVKEFQILLANRLLRRYGHNMKIPRMIKSLLNLGLVNSDAADSFLTSLMLMQDFDKVTEEKHQTRGKWKNKWNHLTQQWEWEYVEY